jgi:molybdate transport system regulatory protein
MTTKITLKLRLLREEEVAMGPGKADLLDAIRQTGSISAAARAMQMSYRRAWLLVDVMNRCFREPLVRGAAGGRQGGGAQVTEAGLRVLGQFRAMEAAALTAAKPHLKELMDQLHTDPAE